MQKLKSKLLNISVSKRDQLMSEVRDNIHIQQLSRIAYGHIDASDIPVIQYLASIVILDLHIESGIQND